MKETANKSVFLPQEEYLTKQTAGELLGVTARTIHTWLREGKLQASKLGHKTVRIKRSSIDKMLDRFATSHE
jgi:excisionase family DNA binding protein